MSELKEIVARRLAKRAVFRTWRASGRCQVDEQPALPGRDGAGDWQRQAALSKAHPEQHQHHQQCAGEFELQEDGDTAIAGLYQPASQRIFFGVQHDFAETKSEIAVVECNGGDQHLKEGKPQLESADIVDHLVHRTLPDPDCTWNGVWTGKRLALWVVGHASHAKKFTIGSTRQTLRHFLCRSGKGDRISQNARQREVDRHGLPFESARSLKQEAALHDC